MYVSMSTHAALVRASEDIEIPMSVFLGCSLRQEAGRHEELSRISGLAIFEKARSEQGPF